MLNLNMKLLQEYHDSVLAQNEASRLRLLTELRKASHIHHKGCQLWVYGSLTQQGRFRQESGIDLALNHEPEWTSIYGVSTLLSETLGRSVDVVLLAETRLQEIILKKGITWVG